MIFEWISIGVLLFILLGLVYQFMPDIFVMVLILVILYVIGYVAVKVFFYIKKKKEGQPVVQQQPVEQKPQGQEVGPPTTV